jgi:hypothetical protein
LIQNKTIEKWNGTLPQVTGGAMPLLDRITSKRSSSGGNVHRSDIASHIEARICLARKS